MKSRLYLVFIVVGLTCFGCGKEAQPMSQELLVNILKDVHIAESLINGHHPAAMKDSLQKRYIVQVLEKWNTSTTEFELAIQSMNGDPDYMREVYDDVKNEISAFSKDIDIPADGNTQMLE